MNNNMIGGSQSVAKAYTPITGLFGVQLVAVNPTTDEIRKITGNEIPETMCNYAAKPSYSGDVQEYPIVFWLHEPINNVYQPITYAVANQPAAPSQNGNIKFINKLGQSTWAANEEALRNNPKMDWFSKEGLRPALHGEAQLYEFMQKFVRYNARNEGANWLADMENAGITIANLVAGNLTGLRNFQQLTEGNDNYLTVLFTVSASEGEGETKYYQNILPRTDAMYWCTNGKVTQGAVKALKSLATRLQEQGRVLSNKYYTFEGQDFVLENCVNYENAPETPEPAMANSPGDDDLPF